jgi:hypothetical protein
MVNLRSECTCGKYDKNIPTVNNTLRTSVGISLVVLQSIRSELNENIDLKNSAIPIQLADFAKFGKRTQRPIKFSVKGTFGPEVMQLTQPTLKTFHHRHRKRLPLATHATHY